MPDLNTFWGSRGKAADLRDDPNRAVDVATMILDNPTSVELKRGSTEIAAQTVLATRRSANETDVSGPSARVAETDLVLIGVQDHPTLDDFNVQRGDIFQLWNTNWRVHLVVSHVPGVIEAHCKGQQ